MREWFADDESEPDCRCTTAFERGTLTVDAADCPGDGRLSESADCLATVVETLGRADVDSVVTAANGVERAYLDGDAALLVAAGRFATRVGATDERLAERTRREPLAAAAEATGRAGRVADLAAETGFAVAAEGVTPGRALDPYVGPAVSDARVAADPPATATLLDRRTVETGATVRRYETPAGELDSYHVRPPEHEFDAATAATLDRAVGLLATTADEPIAPEAAAERVVDDGHTATRLASVLRKHTEGLGILEDIFADPRVSDVFATAPVEETGLRVRADGETLRTNVRLTERGARSLASTFRRTSGRAFSRASPTLDATTTVADRRVRVAGVTAPVSDGVGFAFRGHDAESFRLPDLVENGSVPPRVAGLLSVAVERGAACLVAGPRGAGKTTTLGALLWELPRTVRTVVIEDTPELPVAALQSAGRDIQPLRTESGDGPAVDATAALRTALRLGDGALVVGEVRGEEARVLYEAMRVGGGDGAVLGTIHGTGGESVLERLVSDLGVPESAVAATDLVVTLAPPTAEGGRGIAAVEEVRGHEDGVAFEPLFVREGPAATATGCIDRGASQLVESLSDAGESYAGVREAIRERTTALGPPDLTAGSSEPDP